MSIDSHGNTFHAVNITLRQLLVNAFGIDEYLINRIPSWAGNARFDISAKLSDASSTELERLTREKRQQMLLKILGDRFALRFHTEVKTLPLFDLVIANGGPKLESSNPSKGSPAPSSGMSSKRGEVEGSSVPMSSLISAISPSLGRKVVDQTGLKGEYTFHLKWTPESSSPEEVQNDANAAPSFFTALQSELGLKLVASKGPVEIVVIDSIQMPTQN